LGSVFFYFVEFSFFLERFPLTPCIIRLFPLLTFEFFFKLLVVPPDPPVSTEYIPCRCLSNCGTNKTFGPVLLWLVCLPPFRDFVFSLGVTPGFEDNFFGSPTAVSPQPFRAVPFVGLLLERSLFPFPKNKTTFFSEKHPHRSSQNLIFFLTKRFFLLPNPPSE